MRFTRVAPNLRRKVSLLAHDGAVVATNDNNDKEKGGERRTTAGVQILLLSVLRRVSVLGFSLTAQQELEYIGRMDNLLVLDMNLYMEITRLSMAHTNLHE